jgi:membrane-associated phospholipid phosphatase
VPVVLGRIDLALLLLARERAHHPRLEVVARRYSRLGEHSYLWFAIAALGIAAHRRERPTYLRLGRAVIAAELSNAALKQVIRRRRPALEGLPALMATNSPLSYPSAHASTSFAAARVLSAAVPPAAVYLLAAAMALSRPYLGVHYPSDIVAGAAFGTALAELVP